MIDNDMTIGEIPSKYQSFLDILVIFFKHLLFILLFKLMKKKTVYVENNV